MRYEDEKYVESLEDEVKALRAKLRLRSEVGGVRPRGMRAAAEGMGGGAEELYRRARTEMAAEAGAAYGRVSLEALYLLPSEFVSLYQRLFLRALRESPGRTGEANPPVKTKAKRGRTVQTLTYEDDGLGGKRQASEKKSVELALDRDPARGGGSARAGGKRHRDHWLIADERAFRLKTTIDRELRELAETISRGLSRAGAGDEPRAAGNGSPANPSSASGVDQCDRCSRFLKGTWSYCPHCGSGTKAQDRSAGR